MAKNVTENTKPPEPQQSLFVLGRTGATGLIAVLLPGLGGLVLLGSLDVVGRWLVDHAVLGAVLYLLAVATCAGLALLPTFALAALGGWTYGIVGGFFLAWAGIIAASGVGFAVSKRVCGGDIETLLERRPKWSQAHRALVHGGRWRALWVVFLLRLAPNMPFAGSNVFFAAAGVSWFSFLAGTALGMAPRTLAAVVIAAGASQLSLDNAYSVWFMVASVLVVMVAMWIIHRIVAKSLLETKTHTPPATAAR